MLPAEVPQWARGPALAATILPLDLDLHLALCHVSPLMGMLALAVPAGDKLPDRHGGISSIVASGTLGRPLFAATDVPRNVHR